MKKILYIALIGAALLSLSACSGDAETKTESVSSESSVSVQQETEIKSEKESTSVNIQGSGSLSSTYNVPMREIYIDVPPYKEIEFGWCELFIDGSKYVAIGHYEAAQEEDDISTKDAHELAFNEIVMGLKNYEGGMSDLNITKEETLDINGIEVYGFEGTVTYNANTPYEAFAKGYSFVIDGCPCEIFGSVHGADQDQASIDEVSNYLDEMIQTLRTEE